MAKRVDIQRDGNRRDGNRRDGERQDGERGRSEGRRRARRRARPEGHARALAPLGREPIPQGGAIFLPGEPLRPTPGIEGAGGRPRQWAFPVGYNIGQRPRATEQTSFEQLRNLAALYDGIQLCVHALRRVTSEVDPAACTFLGPRIPRRVDPGGEP